MPKKKSRTSRHARVRKIDAAIARDLNEGVHQQIKPIMAKTNRRKMEATAKGSTLNITNDPIDPETGEDLL